MERDRLGNGRLHCARCFGIAGGALLALLGIVGPALPEAPLDLPAVLISDGEGQITVDGQPFPGGEKDSADCSLVVVFSGYGGTDVGGGGSSPANASLSVVAKPPTGSGEEVASASADLSSGAAAVTLHLAASLAGLPVPPGTNAHKVELRISAVGTAGSDDPRGSFWMAGCGTSTTTTTSTTSTTTPTTTTTTPAPTEPAPTTTTTTTPAPTEPAPTTTTTTTPAPTEPEPSPGPTTTPSTTTTTTPTTTTTTTTPTMVAAAPVAPTPAPAPGLRPPALTRPQAVAPISASSPARPRRPAGTGDTERPRSPARTSLMRAADGGLVAGGAVPRGDLLRYRVAGLPPTVPVAIELHSEPVTLLRTRSDARGVVDVSFRVPRDAPAGDHQIVAVAVDPATGTVVAIPTPIRLSSDVRDIVLDQHPWWLVTGVGAAATLAAAIELSARRRGRRRGSPARCYPR